MRIRKGTAAHELTDLDVDRVDGVDKPATGRRFLPFKNGDGVTKSLCILATAAPTLLDGLAQMLGGEQGFGSPPHAALRIPRKCWTHRVVCRPPAGAVVGPTRRTVAKFRGGEAGGEARRPSDHRLPGPESCVFSGPATPSRIHASARVSTRTPFFAMIRTGDATAREALDAVKA